MPPRRRSRYARVAITLPAEDLASADRLAREQDRSRSWIVAEAIRRYASEGSADHSGRHASSSEPGEVRGGDPPVRVGLGASRLAQLKRDLTLTPEQRVVEAEATLRLDLLRPRALTHRVIAFDRYEDFLEWQRTRVL